MSDCQLALGMHYVRWLDSRTCVVHNICSNVEKAINCDNTNMAIISGGCTSKVQECDGNQFHLN